MKRTLGLIGVVTALVLAVSVGSGAARTTVATVGVYASGTSFTATGHAPAGAGASASLALPIGGVGDAEILVRGAQHVAIASPTIESPLQLNVLFAHYVSVAGTLVPDALEPWDGTRRATEHTNQPLWLQVKVPAGTAPGAYTGSVQVVADGVPTTVPIAVTVFNVTLPPPGQVSGAFLTAFNVSPQSYGAEVNKLYGIPANESLPGLFSFLSDYGISPNNWGYGNPISRSGYTTSRKWWLDKAANMVSAVGSPRRFASMWIPVSNNRSTTHELIAGLSPYKPGTWCPYLKSVRRFWEKHGWLNGSYPYLYGMDEPGTNLFKTVAQQDTVLHTCFPGAKAVVTGHPIPSNKILWNGGKADLDVWAVLSSRYYGERSAKRSTLFLKYINQARKHHEQIWTYTYGSNANTTPGFTAKEPPTNPRMFADWAALEDITGMLRGQGSTTYTLSVNPLSSLDRSNGDFVLIYPGRDAPIASARLEEFREGIEDWEILNIVRQKHGQKAVVHLLSKLFSTTATGAKLGCIGGCAIKTNTVYSWPLYSHDATTPDKLAAMRLAALTAAS